MRVFYTLDIEGIELHHIYHPYMGQYSLCGIATDADSEPEYMTILEINEGIPDCIDCINVVKYCKKIKLSK